MKSAAGVGAILFGLTLLESIKVHHRFETWVGGVAVLTCCVIWSWLDLKD